MGIIIVDQYQHIVVECQYGEDLDNAIEVSRAFCKAMAIGSIIIHHNALVLQVTTREGAVYNRNQDLGKEGEA